TTFIPASVKARAMPSPIPLSPPVMKATLPATSFIGVGMTRQSRGESLPPEPAPSAGSPPVNAAAEPPIAASVLPPRNFRRARPAEDRVGFETDELRSLFASVTGFLLGRGTAIFIRPRSCVKRPPRGTHQAELRNPAHDGMIRQRLAQGVEQ